jgi:hypothetical protein
MKRWSLLLLGFFAVVAHADPEDVLIEAEAAFAKDVADLGVRDGFLKHLIEESVVFRPLPTAARAWFEAQEAPGFTLSWRPWFAEISASGDFGYTVGPWTSRALAAAESDGADEAESEAKTRDKIAHGFYVTVWIKDRDSAWHPLVDHGIGGTELAAVHDDIIALGEGRSAPIQGSYLLNARYQGLMAAALRLPLAQGDDAIAIERNWLADDLIVLRAGTEPTQGEDAVRRVLDRSLGGSPPAMTLMAESGDLGMSVGGEPGRSAYLRLWRHSDAHGWQLAVDVATHVAATEKTPADPE